MTSGSNNFNASSGANFMRLWSFLTGAVTALVVLSLSIFGYFRLGMAPVATAAPPMMFEHALAKAALHARINREMPTSAPIAPDGATFLAGARVYEKNCAVCHGVPGQAATLVARGMFPKPPQLFVKTVADDPAGEIYWKTKNGIRLTGMPGFTQSLSETELWQVSLLLKHADQLPDDVRKQLASNSDGQAAGR
jgi:thiosulfate dehydrogenase